MKRLLAIALGATVLTPTTSDAQQAKPVAGCTAGPVAQHYGGMKWNVFGCTDHSVIVVSTPESPANPFLFTFQYRGGHYALAGVGTGNKSATDAAFKDLAALSQGDLDALFISTQKR